MKIASPLTLNLTDTRAFKIWLYQLWQGVGGDTDASINVNVLTLRVDAIETDLNAIETDLNALTLRVDAIESNYTLAKQTIVNVGSSYVLDKTINVIDAAITANSIIECSIAPVATGYTRPVEEVIYERIMVYATPKNGSIDFYLQPERGHFKGEFVINYMVKK